MSHAGWPSGPAGGEAERPLPRKGALAVGELCQESGEVGWVNNSNCSLPLLAVHCYLDIDLTSSRLLV